MSNHTLSYKEIMSIPAGRIMNTFIQEYVFGVGPSRWSNSNQVDLPTRWFDEHPRTHDTDDGGYCSADSAGRYSTDISAALSMIEPPVASLAGRTLKTETEVLTEGTASSKPVILYWASFSDVRFSDKSYYTQWRKRSWASGETMALAICRAALLAV